MIRNRCLFLSMVLLGVCLFTPQKSLAQSTIACNSDDMKRHSCAVDTRGGVRLVTQNSQAPCTEGRSWGTDNQGIWVDDGCRADFAVGERRDYQDQNRNERNQPSAAIAGEQIEGIVAAPESATLGIEERRRKLDIEFRP